MRSIRKFLPVICFIFFSFFNNLQASTWNLPAQVISTPGEFSIEPSVSISLSPNNIGIAVWQANSKYIKSATFNGTTWSTPISVTDPTGSANNPQVAINSSDQALAVWQDQQTNLIIQSSLWNGSSWSTPVNVSTAGQDASTPTVGISSSGTGVAVWSRSNGANLIVQASLWNGSTWSVPVNLSAVGEDATLPQVVMNAAGNAIAVWQRSNGTNQIIQASFYNGSSWSSPTDISAVGSDNTAPNVSINASGNAVLGWLRGSISSVQVALFTGGSWGSPTTLTSTQSGMISTSINDAGNAVALFSLFVPGGTNNIYASLYNGTSWSSPTELSGPNVENTPFGTAVGIDAAGNVYTIWNRANQVESSFYNKFTNTWSIPVVLSLAQSFNPIVLAVNPPGNALAAFTSDQSIAEIFATESFSESAFSTVVANPTSVLADGVAFSTITVTLLDSNQAPIVGHTVSLTAESGSSVISAPSGPSNASGVVTFTVRDSQIETVVYFATDVTDSVTINQTAQVSFTTPEGILSTVTANPTSVPADGLTTSTITVTLLNNSGPIVGNTVSLAALNGTSVISPPSGPSNSSGVVTFTVTDNTSETVNYQATDTTTGIVISQTASVSFVKDESTQSTVVANPTMVPANGIDFSTITITLLDSNNNPIVGNNVTLTPNGGSSVISNPSGPSDSNGQVIFTVSDTEIETVVYQATDTTTGITILQTATVVFAFTEASASTVTANPTTVVNDGIETSTITVTLRNGSNNPIVGNTVSLVALNGSSQISPPSGPSNNSGVVTFTVTDTVAETVIYQAIDTTNSITINQVAIVTFASNEAQFSTVVANPLTVPADGTSFSSITVTLLDGDLPLAGHVVTLTAENGSSVITPQSGTTNTAGQFVFKVTDTTIETVTYFAVDETTSTTILQTAQVSFVQPPPSPPRNLEGERIKNKFATQTEYVDILTWQPSSDPTTVAYWVYQGSILLGAVPVNGTLSAIIHDRAKNKAYTYHVVAVSATGLQSAPATITIK